jgi:GxxExxY protein
MLTENQIATILVDISYNVHKTLGPGLLESVYEEAIAYELKKRNLDFTRQEGIPVYYGEIKMEIGFRADIVVNNKVIVEIKSVETILPVHFKQLLTYLRLSNLKLGLLVNFNESLIKNGIQRIANNL